MRALVFADRLGAELQPLTATWSVPLLPIAGKEVLVYTIEDLVSAGIRDLVVVASAHGRQAGATTLGEGQRWGASIRYVLSRGEEPPSAVWPRLNLADAQAVVVLRGDVLRSPAVAPFLDQAQSKVGTSTFCGRGDPRASLFLVRPGCPNAGDLLDCLRWERPNALPAEDGCVVEEGSVNCLEGLAAFHRANLDLVADRSRGLGVAGRSVALGLRAGRRASVSPRSLKKGVAYVGANSRVHAEAELLGEVVIGDDVVVDRAATVRDSVILPGTYVGELVEVGNAIVAGDHLMRVDTGALLRISDAFLLGRLGGRQGPKRTSVWDRLAGLVLLTLSLPLWPVAAATAALRGGGPLLERLDLLGNPPLNVAGGAAPAERFVAWRWRTPVPVLRDLPRLLAVVQGHLRLFGVAPLTPVQSESRTEDWQRVRDQAPVGLLGPTQLDLPEDAPLEERLLSDAFYARAEGRSKNARYLWRGLKMLLSGEAWRPAG